MRYKECREASCEERDDEDRDESMVPALQLVPGLIAKRVKDAMVGRIRFSDRDI